MDLSDIRKSYDAYYFAHEFGERPYLREEGWLRFFASIAEAIVRDINPRTVLDAGCAMGMLVEALRDLGIDAAGVDVSEYAVRKVRADIRPYCWVASLLDPLPGSYDLIVIIEVLEHLPESECERVIENLCAHTDDILFSSTPFDYKETTHLNVRPPEFWAEMFARRSFFRDVNFDTSFLTAWARRFRKTTGGFPRVVADYDRRLWQLEQENQARRQATLEQRDRLAVKHNEIELLSGELARKEQVEQDFSTQLTQEREKVEALKVLLSEKQQQAERLQAEIDDSKQDVGKFTARLSEQYESIHGFIVQLAGGQISIQSLLGRLIESEPSGGPLTSRIEELSEEIANEQQAMEAITSELADKERVVQALTSQEHEKDRIIGRLSMKLKGQERIIESFSLELAEKEAQLTSITNSMGWNLLSFYGRRIKHPHLLPLYRLYGKIKYAYLTPIYKRFRLMPGDQAKHAAHQARANWPEPSAPKAAAVVQEAFPITAIASPPRLQAHRASVDIVICVHNALDDVKRCLESVVRYTRMPYALAIVDDGSREETREYLARFANSQGATLIRNEQARGYTYAANQGVRRSTADYVVLLNSDTVVTPYWLDRMVACGEADSRVGLIGPLSNAASWQSIPEVIRNDEFVDNKLPEGVTPVDISKLVAHYSARLYPRSPFLNGFCLMIKREVIKKVGYFDEETFGQGYGEENDYCLRARQAAWLTAVADDAYVYHSRSRSYSHERRRQLTGRSDQALVAKHDGQTITDGISECRHGRLLSGVRARCRVMTMRNHLIEDGRSRWEGKRVLFILPITEQGGGANVILQEAKAMHRMGVDVRILTRTSRLAAFERAYPENTLPVIDVETEHLIGELIPSYDAVVAAISTTVEWLGEASSLAKPPVRGYYIQDFEPAFFPKSSEDYRISLSSYTLYSDLVRVTKTEWNRDAVRREIGVDCSVVGPSVDIDTFRPRHREDGDWPSRPLRIAAMIRPSTPRRNPQLTMEVLKEIQKAHGETIEIILFGCRSDDPGFRALPRDFAWRNAGILTRPQVASLLNEIDIFVDFSKFQAMGLTALEAMACGAAVIVPQEGGSNSFARHKRNSVIVNTDSQAACLSSLERLAMDEELRRYIQRQAITDSCEHFPERPASNILDALFPEAHTWSAT